MKKCLTFIVFLLFMSPSNSFSAEKLQGDGHLRLYNYHLDEMIEVQYQVKGKLVESALEKLNHFLRSRDNGAVTPVDINLIFLIDHLQDHFGVDTVEIISGYRRPEFNQKLLKKGRKVSPVSLHKKGKALDIHLDEIREETLKNYLLKLKRGGVGFYDGLDFVHIDMGKPRYWSEKKSKRKLIGVLKPQAPIQLTSDKNEYLPGENLYFTWNFSSKTTEKNLKHIQLEKFHRGKWLVCPQSTPQKARDLSQLPSSSLSCHQEKTQRVFGKYRWVFLAYDSKEKHSSNEFYLKKE